MAITQRAFPYPWKGMVSISNDNDGGNLYGLAYVRQAGHELGDSFWFWKTGHQNGDGVWAQASMAEANADAIEKYVKCGWIDSIQSMGDFVQQDAGLNYNFGLSNGRTLWQNASNWFDSKGLSRFCNYWIDHHPYSATNDPTQYNKQDAYFFHNVNRVGWGADSNPANPWYHTDLTCRKDMVRFGWYSEYGDYDLFWELDIADGLSNEYGEREVPNGGLAVSSLLDGVITLRDGGKFWGFKRWCGYDILDGGQNWDKEVQMLVTDHRLAYAAAHPGFLCVYTHVNNGGGDIGGFFDAYASIGYKSVLASRQLLYNFIRDNAIWSSWKESNGREVINIEGCTDAAFGDYTPPVAEMRGLTFYVDDSSDAVIALNGVIIEESIIVRSAADYTGRQSIGIAWYPTDTTNYNTWTLQQVRDKFDVETPSYLSGVQVPEPQSFDLAQLFLPGPQLVAGSVSAASSLVGTVSERESVAASLGAVTAITGAVRQKLPAAGAVSAATAISGAATIIGAFQYFDLASVFVAEKEEVSGSISALANVVGDTFYNDTSVSGDIEARAAVTGAVGISLQYVTGAVTSRTLVHGNVDTDRTTWREEDEDLGDWSIDQKPTASWTKTVRASSGWNR